MGHRSKRPRLGLTRDNPYTSLHPKARDVHSSAAKPVPAIELDVNAPPESSSDSEHVAGDSTPQEPASTRAPLARESSPPSDSDEAESQFSLLSTKQIRKNMATYGRRKADAAPAQSKSKAKSTLPRLHANTKTPRRETAASSPATFKMPATVSLNKKKPAFHMPAEATGKPPTKEATFKMPRTVKQARPEAPTFRMPPASTEALQLLPKSQLPAGLLDPGSSHGDETTMPSSSPAQPIPSSNTTTSLYAPANTPCSPPAETASDTCPICREPVSPESLAVLESTLPAANAQNRDRFRQQAAFCRAHREQTARVEWTERGYPDIDWAALPSRFEKYQPAMLAILDGSRSSYHRDELTKRLATRRAQGEHTTRIALAKEFMRDGDNGETLGYYGGRGGGLMMSWLAQKLAEPLWTAASKDPLVKSCGSISAFVQTVLVPELATFLVVEDSRASTAEREKDDSDVVEIMPTGSSSNVEVSAQEAEAARMRLRQSAELGRLLCPDIDDDILVDDSDGGAESEHALVAKSSDEDDDDTRSTSTHDDLEV